MSQETEAFYANAVRYLQERGGRADVGQLGKCVPRPSSLSKSIAQGGHQGSFSRALEARRDLFLVTRISGGGNSVALVVGGNRRLGGGAGGELNRR